MAKKRTTGITAKLTDSTGTVLAEDKGDGKGLQEVGDNLKKSLAEIGRAARVIYDEHDVGYMVPVDGEGNVKFDKTGVESVRYEFTDKERAEIASEAGNLRLEAAGIKSRLDSMKKQLQGEIDSLEASINLALQKCRDGFEYREARTGTILHTPKKGQKIIVKLDDLEVVRVAQMQAHEFQEVLKFDDAEEGEDSEDEAGDEEPPWGGGAA